MRDAVCEYLIARSPRHPVADLPCGRRASLVGPDGEYLCGTHVRAMYRRRARAGKNDEWDRRWAKRLEPRAENT